MRYAKCFPAVALAVILAAGCSSPREEARKKLREAADKARTLYKQANGGVADKDDAEVGGAAANKEQLKKLSQAGTILTKALADAGGDAPESTAAEARGLLGKILLARGQLETAAADAFCSSADRRREAVMAGLQRVLSHVNRVEFNKALAAMTPEAIVAKQKELSSVAASLAGKMQAAGNAASQLQRESDSLVAESSTRQQQANSLRDEMTGKSAKQQYELLSKALALEAAVRKLSGEIAAKQKAIAVHQEDKRLLAAEKSVVDANLGELAKHATAADERKRTASEAMDAAQRKANDEARAVEKEVRAVAEACSEAAKREVEALKALDKAVTQLGKAASAAKNQLAAARAANQGRTDILDTLKNDYHQLAGMVGAKAAASLAAGRLRSRQLATAASNKALADAVSSVWAKLPRRSAPTSGLRSYLANAAETRRQAEEDFKAAEEGLKKIENKTLKVGKENINWLYKAELAGAYLSHYRLTGTAAVLEEAKGVINDALQNADSLPAEDRKKLTDLQKSIEEAARM